MRREYFRKLCQTTVLAGVLTYPAAAQQLADNTNGKNDSGALEEVTVTAQKKSESLQTTPIAITALTSAALDNRGITSTMDLQGSIPNFQVEALTANLSSVNISMRGASDTQGALETDESPVGLYIDNVYHSRLAGAVFQFTDIERIEVLRGPQGTLYGRNTVAGAINIITKKPKDDYWADLEVGGGSFGTIEAKGSVGGPVVENMLGASVAFVSMNTDGYQFNRALNYGVGHQHDFAGHVNLHLFGIDNFDAVVSLSTVSNKDDGYNPTPVHTNVGVGAATEDLGQVTYTAGGPDVTQSPVPGYGHNEQWTASLDMSYDLGVAKLRSITGYTDLYDRYAGDFNGGVAAAPGVYVTGFYRDGQARDQQFSQELQVTGDALNSTLSYIGGLYYFHEAGQQDLKDRINFGPFVYFAAPTLFNLTTDGFAGYAQGTYHFTDALSMTAGLRYSTDQKRQNASIGNGFASPPVIAYVNQNKGFHTITPKLELDYQITPDQFAYVSVSEGFQSGGYSGLAVGDPTILQTSYHDETVWSYETGLKSSFFDHRLRVNTAFFYALYYGLQQTAAINASLLDIAQENVGNASVYGLELEVTAAITSELSSSFNLGLMHTQYDALSPLSTAYQDHEVELPEAPNYTGQFSLDYNHPIDADGHNRLIVGGSLSMRGGERVDATGSTRADALATVQAYVGTRLFDDQWEIRLDVKNLTDTRKLTCCTITSTGGIVTPPRMFLASAKYHY